MCAVSTLRLTADARHPSSAAVLSVMSSVRGAQDAGGLAGRPADRAAVPPAVGALWQKQPTYGPSSVMSGRHMAGRWRQTSPFRAPLNRLCRAALRLDNLKTWHRSRCRTAVTNGRHRFSESCIRATKIMPPLRHFSDIPGHCSTPRQRFRPARPWSLNRRTLRDLIHGKWWQMNPVHPSFVQRRMPESQ